MFRGSYHPKAFLMRKRNVGRGLTARTEIISSLEGNSSTASVLGEKTGSSYSSVLYHLHSMEDEHTVVREGGKPYTWKLTGMGQKTLNEIQAASSARGRVPRQVSKEPLDHS